MQTFNLINAQDRVKKSRATINANFEAVASNFSGIAFPTVNLYVGMKCYRTDLNQTFTLNNVELQTWVDDSDIADKAITTEKLADQSVTKEKISHGAVTTEKIGNSAVTADKIASRSITQDKIAIGILTAHNVGAYTQNEVYNKGELFNRTESDNRYYQKAQTYSKAETYNRGEVDDKMNTRVSKSGDSMTANLRFNGSNVGLTADSGYMQFNGSDTGDAIAGGNGANVNIGSLYGLGFYSIYGQRYTGTMDLRTGDWRTVGQMTAHEGFIVRGNSGFVFDDHNGGWYMSDNDWVRSRANKSIYTGGKMKADGGFEGTATSAHYPNGFNSSFYSNQGWGNQTGTTITSWRTPNGGAIDFRENGNKLNVKIDGVFYQEEGTYQVLDVRGGTVTGSLRANGGFIGNLKGKADSSTVSDRAVRVENDVKNMRFHWAGQSGQPTWLWGGNDGENMYVYNPSNFNVNRATTAGRADNSDRLGNNTLQDILNRIAGSNTGITAGNLAENGWVKFANGLIVQWGAVDLGQVEKYTTVNFPIRFPNRVLCLIPARRNRGNTASAEYGDVPMSFDLKQESFQIHFALYPLFWLALGI